MRKNESSDEESDDWDELELPAEDIVCLFCSLRFQTITQALDHCRSVHNFDLLKIKIKHSMDCYSYIKMINYIRKQHPQAVSLVEAHKPVWEDDAYLKTTGKFDAWLMFDFDDFGSSLPTPNMADDCKLPSGNINHEQLQRQIHQLNVLLQQKNLMLEAAMEDINRMKRITRTIVDSGDVPDENGTSSNCEMDYNYFNSYSHFGIHLEMLSDKVRTESYRDAILMNAKSVFEGKTVLDVGCGTAILSMFAARAGAQSVYAIDQSEVAYKAMEIIRENGLQHCIHLMRGRVETISLPVQKVDVIISEWMGYFLLFEGMLDSVLDARDRYLATDGHIMPNRCKLYLVGCSDMERYKKTIEFWHEVYGFSMNSLKPVVVSEAFIDVMPEECIITNTVHLLTLDIHTCNKCDVEFSCRFVLTADREGPLTSLCGYFDVFFDEYESAVHFSTGPRSPKTHWQQTIFYLRQIIHLNKGDELAGTLSCNRRNRNNRGLLVTITLNNQKNTYTLD